MKIEPAITPVWLRQVARSKRLHAQDVLSLLARLGPDEHEERAECIQQINELEIQATNLDDEAHRLETDHV